MNVSGHFEMNILVFCTTHTSQGMGTLTEGNRATEYLLLLQLLAEVSVHVCGGAGWN